MNGLERILATVRHGQPDRVPIVPQVFGHAARLGGVPLRRYLTDATVLAQCQLDAWRDYGTDAMFGLFDACVETEALGSGMRYPEDGYPDVERFILEQPGDVAQLRIPDPGRAGRMPVALEALRRLRQEGQDQAMVAGCVLGPMTLACQLMGIEKTLFAAVDETPAFERMLDFAVEVALAYGSAQLKAGAHLCIVFDPSASPAVVPLAFFRELLMPRLRRLCQGLKDAGALATWLHIAGPAEPILPLYPACGVDIACIDYCVDPGRARALAPGLCLTGNVRPLAFVDSEPAAIAESCAQILGIARMGGFMLSSGCELPVEARPECVRALTSAALAEV